MSGQDLPPFDLFPTEHRGFRRNPPEEGEEKQANALRLEPLRFACLPNLQNGFSWSGGHRSTPLLLLIQPLFLLFQAYGSLEPTDLGAGAGWQINRLSWETIKELVHQNSTFILPIQFII